jgi:proteasome regulatory subunit
MSEKKIEKMDHEGLKTYTGHLEKRLRNLETEKQLLDAERFRLEQELHSLRNEIDRLREPPLVVGVIVKVLDEVKGRVIVQSTNGPLFEVNLSRKIKNEKIEAGMFVSLNQRTFAVMDFLDVTSEEIRNARKSYMVTEYLFKLAEDDKENERKFKIL